MFSPVAVCAKWNLRFDLIDVQRNLYKRAQDDHPHHLTLIFADDQPILLVHLLLLSSSPPRCHGAVIDNSREDAAGWHKSPSSSKFR